MKLRKILLKFFFSEKVKKPNSITVLLAVHVLAGSPVFFPLEDGSKRQQELTSSSLASLLESMYS